MQTIWGLQYLRAVAALSVLLFHAALGSGGPHALGTGGVDIFFVLSGFLMFHLASADPRPGAFAWARIRRIVPTYWLVTLIVAALQIGGMTGRSSFDPWHVVRSFLFLPSLDEVRQKIYPILIVGWTLNYEMFFYAIVSLSLFLPARFRFVSIVAVFASLIAARHAVASPSILLSFYGDSIIIEFALGAAIAVARSRDRLPPYGWWLVVAGALLMLAPPSSIMPRFVAYGFPASMILIGVLAEEGRKPLPRIRKLKLLGDASYSIYLWHLFVVAAVFRLFGHSAPVFALAVFCGVVIGLISYALIERPSMAILKRLERPRPRHRPSLPESTP